MTQERQRFHELLRVFAARLKPDATVYDVGSGGLTLKEFFPTHNYIRIDKAEKAHPDYQWDMEQRDYPQRYRKTADALICNGVLESTDNPFAFVLNCNIALKKGGLALFGIMSVGYPLSDKHDYIRFTPIGATRLLERCGFKIVEWEWQHYRDESSNVPTYIFLTAEAS